MLFGLSEKVIKSISSVLLQEKRIEKVLIYGSRAKGTFREGSDIDLTIIATGMNDSDLLPLKRSLNDLSIPYRIDLSLYDEIGNEELKDHIVRVGKEFPLRQ